MDLGGGVARIISGAWLQPYLQRAPKLGVLVASRFVQTKKEAKKKKKEKKKGLSTACALFLFCGEKRGAVLGRGES